MKRPTNALLTNAALQSAAEQLDAPVDQLTVRPVSGGFSRNRRAVVSAAGQSLFVKEVDIELLPDDGLTELGWLKKDYEVVRTVQQMHLFDNQELSSYLYNAASHSGAIAVNETNKTVYDYVTVDSEVEYNFMKSLEADAGVKFYIKLPSWFKIPTPLGNYNPDWAVAFDGDERIYFVAETKGSNDINDPSISSTERGKIKSARRHFAEIEVPYVAPASDWLFVAQSVRNVYE